MSPQDSESSGPTTSFFLFWGQFHTLLLIMRPGTPDFFVLCRGTKDANRVRRRILKGSMWLWGRVGGISIIDPSIQDPPWRSSFKSPRLCPCLTQNPEQRHSSPYGIFSFVMLHRVGWSFGTSIMPFESLWRAFKSPMGFIHTKQRGRPKAVPHSLLTIL